MRITEKDLQAAVARINRITGSPSEPYARNESGNLVANVGNYHLSRAYGGVSLHRMHNEGGAVSTPLSCGHIAKRDLYHRLHAFIAGLEAGK